MGPFGPWPCTRASQPWGPAQLAESRAPALHAGEGVSERRRAELKTHSGPAGTHRPMDQRGHGPWGPQDGGRCSDVGQTRVTVWKDSGGGWTQPALLPWLPPPEPLGTGHGPWAARGLNPHRAWEQESQEGHREGTGSPLRPHRRAQFRADHGL